MRKRPRRRTALRISPGVGRTLVSPCEAYQPPTRRNALSCLSEKRAAAKNFTNYSPPLVLFMSPGKDHTGRSFPVVLSVRAKMRQHIVGLDHPERYVPMKPHVDSSSESGGVGILIAGDETGLVLKNRSG